MLQAPPERAGTGDAGLHPWQLFTLAALISAAIITFLAGSRPSSVRVALILIVFAAAATGVGVLRMLSPFTARYRPPAPPVAGGRTRAALEREKMLALRSIKELEFDRAMGKVSEKDFLEMSGRLRNRAARLLRQLDAGNAYREQIERDVALRVGSAAGSPEPAPAADAGSAPRDPAYDEEPVGRVPRSGPAETSVRTCAACATPNDPDARFCKGCGSKLEAV
jgi:hypothetical protein